MLVPASTSAAPILKTLSLLVCVDGATCKEKVTGLVQALEQGGCKPTVWCLDESAQAPVGVVPLLTLVGAAAHVTSELRMVQVVHHLRHSFDAPVLMLPALVAEQARIAPWRNPFDGALPHVGDAHFFTQLHLWLRLQDAEARAQAYEQRHTAQVGVYEQLFSQLPFGVILAESPSGAITYQNPSAAQICGMAMPSVGTHDGYDQFQVMTGEDTPLPAHQYPIVRSLVSGAVVVDEGLRFRRGDGCIIDLRVHSAPVRNSAGVITGAICLFRDITAQNASALLRRRASLRLQQIADAAPSHAIVVDAQGRYSFANRTHCLWTRRSEAELLGRPLAEQLKRSHYPLVQCALDEALAGNLAAIEHVLTDVDGVGQHFLIRWAPLYQEDTACPDIIGAIGYFVDIDALRQVEMQMAQREMRFTFMSESLPVKVFTTDVHGGLNYVNASWHDYTGRTCEASLGFGWTSFVHPDDLPRLEANMPIYARATRAVNLEYRLRRYDGLYRWHRARCMPLPALSDAHEGREWVGVVIDIHEELMARKKAEQHARETEAQSQLAMAAAGQARKEVGVMQQERAAREQFVAMLSHDLRTPLTAARMGIERLQEALKDDAKLSRIATRVARSISRTDVMLEDFLDVSRVCAGKPLPLTRTAQSLRDIVESTLQELDPLHASRCILAESQQGQGAWDASSVQRVVENLVGNARKYGERHRPITLRVQERDGEVVLTVHNYGEAIAPEDQKRLFEHFSRLETAEVAGERGWGIGLTLVAGIARAYGGQVSVHSAAEIGTTFCVALPRHSA